LGSKLFGGPGRAWKQTFLNQQKIKNIFTTLPSIRVKKQNKCHYNNNYLETGAELLPETSYIYIYLRHYKWTIYDMILA
jgi:hypothetical protein